MNISKYKLTTTCCALLAFAYPLVERPPPRVDLIYQVMRRISRMEGFYKQGTIPRTHNNPGALVFRRQRGATPGKRGRLHRLRFARFKTEAAGWEALERDVRLKLARGIPLTVGWRYL